MEVTLAAFQKRYQYKSPSDLIGKGGFSDVYKAWDTQDEQFVALKIATASASEKYDLTNEVKKIKKLKHPNLIEYYDLYEVCTGTKDIHGHELNYQVAVMEYADGGTLGDLLKNKPLTNTEAEELAEGIIDGLAYLHANNITHRDLKPANILLTTKDGKRIPKITDFGLAKNTAAGNTASTMLVGTVEYMAPEFFKQAEGETTTAAADVWSIGVILLEALTGIHPFGKTTQGKSNEQIIYNILSADLNPSLQNLRAPFKELITRCLIREPRLRTQTAEELKGLLQNAPNDFSERTQIIDYKPQAKIVNVPESKWKKWGKALFDFDFRNGNWKKILARELLLALMLVFFVFGTVYTVLFVQWIIDVDNNEFLDEIFYLLSLVVISIFYILRFVIFIFNWMITTLGIELPSISEKTIKRTKYGFLILLLLGIIGLLAYYLKENFVKNGGEDYLEIAVSIFKGKPTFDPNEPYVSSDPNFKKEGDKPELQLPKGAVLLKEDSNTKSNNNSDRKFPSSLPMMKEKKASNDEVTERNKIKKIEIRKAQIKYIIVVTEWTRYSKTDEGKSFSYPSKVISNIIKLKKIDFEIEYNLKQFARKHDCYSNHIIDFVTAVNVFSFDDFESAANYRSSILMPLDCSIEIYESTIAEIEGR